MKRETYSAENKLSIEHKGFSHAGNHFLPGKKRICELTQIIYGDVNKV